MTKTRCLNRVSDALNTEPLALNTQPLHHNAGGATWQAVIRPLQWIKRFGFGHINDVQV